MWYNVIWLADDFHIDLLCERIQLMNILHCSYVTLDLLCLSDNYVVFLSFEVFETHACSLHDFFICTVVDSQLVVYLQT